MFKGAKPTRKIDGSLVCGAVTCDSSNALVMEISLAVNSSANSSGSRVFLIPDVGNGSKRT